MEGDTRIRGIIRKYAWKLRGFKYSILHRFQPLLFNDKDFLSYVVRKKVGFDRCKSNIETLAFRGSTADFAFHSPSIENSYNMGLTSSDLYNTYQLYKLNSKEMPKLKNVILYYSVSIPGYSLIHTRSKYLSTVYKYFFNIPYLYSQLIEKKYEDKIIGKCEKYRDVEVLPDYLGFDKKKFDKGIKAIDRVKTHLRENVREPDQHKWLIKLNNLIIEEGRTLYIVIPFFRSDYKKLLPDESIIFKKLYELDIKGAEIINFYNSNLFSDMDMGDPDHMNEEGAKKITLEIKKIIER